MAGHSQFANIKHRKESQDSKRSKIFTKIQREITAAIKTGGDKSEEFNPRLRLAIIKAKGVNMPKDKIDAAIKKATGEGMLDNFEAIRYDCYAPNGIPLIIEALTDNKNRTAGEVRAIITKAGGNMGETGSLDFLFQKIGIILYEKSGITFDDIFEKAIDLSAENIEENDNFYEILTKFEDFHKIQVEISSIFGNPVEASIQYRALSKPEITQEKLESVQKLVDALEDLDDVQSVWW